MSCVSTPLHMSSLNTLGCAVLGVGTFPDIFRTSQCSFQGSTHWRHPINSCTKYEPILSSAVCIWESPGVRITICNQVSWPQGLCFTCVHCCSYHCLQSFCLHSRCLPLSLMCELYLVFSACPGHLYVLGMFLRCQRCQLPLHPQGSAQISL